MSRTADFVVRPMAAPDLPAVLALERASGTNPWGHAAFADDVLHGRDNGFYLVASQAPAASSEGQPPAANIVDHTAKDRAARSPSTLGMAAQILGFAIGTANYDEVHVLSVAVRPEWYRHGVGERLVRTMLGEARQRGFKVAVLEVRASNSAAQTLYAKLGFQSVGRRPRFYPDTSEDALIMTLDLRSE